ncbi:MAG: hypothetical protein WDO24_24240 [Pseudomonadota bacterium]
MIVPTLSPYVMSLIALTQPAQVAAAPPAQAVTKRPAMPAGKGEMPRPRDKRDRDNPDKRDRGQSTDLVV